MPGISLLELSDKVCRFPLGHPEEEGFSFCGKPVQPGYPYCPEHCAVVYQERSVPRPGARRWP